jgi:hypothetical protein
MISEKHSQAARANGARSRGPVTPRGKAASARNAIRHGLLAKTVVLSTEEASRFAELFASLVDRFSLVDDVEMSAIEEMAAAQWRSRRAIAMEHEILEAGIANQPPAPPLGKTTAAFCDPANHASLTLLQRYETRLQNIYQRALRTLLQLRKLAAKPPVPNEPRRPIVCNTVCATDDAQLDLPEVFDPPFEPVGTAVAMAEQIFASFEALAVP